MTEPLIVAVIHRYHPHWQPPKDTGKPWVRCLCPFHPDETPSAAVSYRIDAFNCLACGVKGTAFTVIHQVEEVTYSEAKRILEEISAGGNRAVPPKPARLTGRRVFDDEGAGVPVDSPRERRPVPTRVCGRTFDGA